MAHPVHFCGFESCAKTLISPRNSGGEIASAPEVQSLTQIEHALQTAASIAGFCHWARFTGTHIFPALSEIASF
jgi:hypothetical protein